MNKTISINLAGFSFSIEETAYQELHSYLEAIKSFLEGEEDVEEIINDIERRIAELLQEPKYEYFCERRRLADGREVVLREDVDFVMEVLGDPKFFQSEPDLDEDEDAPKRKKKKAKRIFRNPDSQIIAGVCGGLGSYFNIDPILFRLIFVISVLSFGFGIIPYIILWIVIPEAKTTAEKLEMEGEPVTVENIKNRFRKESQNVKDSYSKFKDDVKAGKNSQAASNLGKALHEILAFIGSVLRLIWHVLRKVIGVIAIALGAVLFLGTTIFIFTFLFGLKWSILGPLGALENSELIDVFFSQSGDFHILLLLAAVFLITIVTGFILVGLNGLGAKLPSKTTLAISIPVVLFVSFSAFATFLLASLNHYENRGISREKTVLENLSSDTLHVMVNEDLYFSSDFRGHHNYHLKLLSLEDDQLISGRVLLDIEDSKDSLWYVEVERLASGRTAVEGRQNAEGIRYNYELQENKIWFDPIFSWDKSLKYRKQEIRITLSVPQGKSIYLSDGCDRIIYDIDNLQDMLDGDMEEKYWLMSEEGLTLAQ
ncbi:MAG: PspC domain-containing protein [Luteibaculum sp.]